MENKQSFFPQSFGIVLLVIGICGLIGTGILTCCRPEWVTNGAIPAMSFLIIIIGLTFAFPTLLQEATGGVSTMRVIVLIVVLVFAVVYIKLGWIAGSFEQFSIDKSWIYILGLAFGSKAFQKFVEKDSDNGNNNQNANDTNNQQQTNNNQ